MSSQGPREPKRGRLLPIAIAIAVAAIVFVIVVAVSNGTFI